MGKINGCLKVVFIIFNSLFTCFGAWLMYSLGRFGNQMDSLSVVSGWVFAAGVVGISMLGSHGARTESKCCLTAYCSEAGCEDVTEFLFNISIGLNFGFAFVAMMGLSISTNMINQIGRHDDAAAPAIAMRTY